MKTVLLSDLERGSAFLFRKALWFRLEQRGEYIRATDNRVGGDEWLPHDSAVVPLELCPKGTLAFMKATSQAVSDFRPDVIEAAIRLVAAAEAMS